MAVIKFGDVQKISDQGTDVKIVIPLKGGGGGSNIKSIQRGTTTLSAVTTNVAITAVDLTKAIVKISYYSPDGANTHANANMTAEITTTTNLAFVLNTYNSSYPPVVTWEIIEFIQVKSLQHGIYTNNTTPMIITITAVNVAKSILFTSFNTADAGVGMYGVYHRAELTNSTTITHTHIQLATMSISYYVVEFY